MKHKIECQPAYAMAQINLDDGENITVESGSMIAMSNGLEIKTHIGGNKKGFGSKVKNLFFALIRKFLGGETLFVNTYSPPSGQDGHIMIAPALTGDIIHKQLDETTSLMVQGASYLASAGDILVKTRFMGLKSLFSSEGMFWLSCGGTGDLWINSYGSIHEIDVDGTYTVDTGHVVAFEDSLDFSIRGAGNLKSTFLSGEGLTMKFKGNGKLWIQSRTISQMIDWISPKLKG